MKYTNQLSPKIFTCHSISELIGFENPSEDYKWSFGLPTLDKLKNIDAFITTPSFPLGYDELISMPKLKVISSYGVGYDYIDISQASKLGILVTNTPNSVTRATGELGVSLVVASVRNIVENDHLTRSKNSNGFANEMFKYPIMAHDFSSQTIGIIGYGRVGKTLFDLVKKLGFEAIYSRAHGALEGHSGYREISQLLSISDVVVLCVPLKEDTYHLINTKSFKLMKSSSKIVNISRGPVIDESSLIQALKSGQISGAALDVFEYEPHISQDLIEMNQVILSPHVATTTIETRKAMTAEAVENIIQALAKTPQNALNLESWKRIKL